VSDKPPPETLPYRPHRDESIPEGLREGVSGDGEPPIRVMALHALLYCERLFYLEEVEEIRIADASVYAGRLLHDELAAPDPSGTEQRNFWLESATLGLKGRVDAFRRREGGWVPYEHKRGRARRDADGSPAAWPSDAVQVSAYGLLLEETLGEPVAEGRIRYHADGVTVRVPLDTAMRNAVYAAIARARELRRSLERPPETEEAGRCVSCSLAPVCLPEEGRFTRDPERQPLRLFPPNLEGQVIHIISHRARIKRAGESVIVETPDERPLRLPVHEIQALVIHGYAQISTQTLHLLAANEIPVHWLTAGGRYIGALVPGPGGVQRRLRQYAALTEPGICLRLARRLVAARIQSQIRYILRATRGGERHPEILSGLEVMRAQVRQVPRTEGVEALRGFEGVAGRTYFALLPHLLMPATPRELLPDGRSRRPPRDRFNALLSFGYALLYRSVMSAVLAVGLEPALGFFHTPRSAAHPLVLDVMELFRVPVWDISVIGSINRRQWDPVTDFVVTKDQVWLSEAGRRKAIDLYETRLQESWKHPVIGYSLSYGRAIELELRLLEKEWTGEPGLFAQSRLR
jgi:CRISPR-associated protein Cas1